jgi:hypothetical protein
MQGFKIGTTRNWTELGNEIERKIKDIQPNIER